VNYPNGIKKECNVIKKSYSKPIYKNRGMNLENDLNETNKYYREKEKAYIYKKPTPIKLVDVDYKKGKILEAYFEMPSTTDYNGIYKGKYIDFEAKETINEKGFPLTNIHKHQIKHIRNIYKEKGICFLIVRFTSINKTYLLMAKDFLYYIDNYEKSIIPIEYFNEKGYIIKDKFIPKIDYLEIIDKMEDV
jgi:recombination protein U